jgi:23S rRNA pseudouridine1911/1915/1917 synthase
VKKKKKRRNGERAKRRTTAGRSPTRRFPVSPFRGKAVPVIRYCDDQVVVVEKPAGLTTMRHPEEAAEFGARGRRFLPRTLADLLPELLAAREKRKRRNGEKVKRRVSAGPSPIRRFPVSPFRSCRAVHRLDKETSGLVVFARTPEAERHLGRQFRVHSIERRYWAVVRGRAKPGTIETRLVRDRGDGRRGSSSIGAGQRAVTHVRVLENLGEFTLVECQLETGRTHQVRIHLGESGTPICGECVYDRPTHGQPFPDHSHSPRLALHASRLDFDHPKTEKRMSWASPLPEEMNKLLIRLRKRKDDSMTGEGSGEIV